MKTLRLSLNYPNFKGESLNGHRYMDRMTFGNTEISYNDCKYRGCASAGKGPLVQKTRYYFEISDSTKVPKLRQKTIIFKFMNIQRTVEYYWPFGYQKGITIVVCHL